MSWQDDINAKLGALIMAKQSKDKYDEAADALVDHANCNIYAGPSMPGDTYCGWPVAALINMIPAHEQPRVRVELMAKLQRGPYAQAAGRGPYGLVEGHAGRQARPHTLEEMMAMRMRWGPRHEGELFPGAVSFAHMAMHAAGDVVHVWIITRDGQSVVLQDDYGLYPSDALITKIRLIQSGDTA